MKTYYEGHDAVYRKKKSSGQTGWDTSDVISENVKLMSKAIKALNIPKSSKVLEIGCGAGDLTMSLARDGYDVTGVDISSSAIEWAKEKNDKNKLSIKFHTDNVTTLSTIVDASFNLVVDGHCLHCIIGDDRAKLFNNVLRVLVTDGIFHVQTMCGDPCSEGSLENYDAESRCQIHGDIATRYYGLPEMIKEEIEQAGFEILDMKVVEGNDHAQEMLFINALKK